MLALGSKLNIQVSRSLGDFCLNLAVYLPTGRYETTDLTQTRLSSGSSGSLGKENSSYKRFELRCMIFSKISGFSRRLEDTEGWRRVKDSPRGRVDREEQHAGRRKVSGNGTIFNLAADMRSVGRRRAGRKAEGTNPIQSSSSFPNAAEHTNETSSEAAMQKFFRAPQRE